jgi:hypothetical protein
LKISSKQHGPGTQEKIHKKMFFLKRPYKVIIIPILLLITFANLSSALWTVKDKYLSSNLSQRYGGLKTEYENSQYVNKQAKAWIPDEPVNTYAGVSYMKGVSPILIAPDTPPLGRYLIGLSGMIFDNENIVTLFSGLISLLFMYLIGLQIYSSRLTALIPIAILSFEPLFKNQFVYTPLLDIIQLMFLLSFFFVFNLGLRKKNNYAAYFLLANTLLGCFIATKFFATGITIAFAALIVLIYNKENKKLSWYLLTLPMAGIVLLLTYVRVLFDDSNMKNFLGIQKWVYLYHKSQLIHPFSVWPYLYLNKWYVWWGNKPFISEGQWMLTWPLVTTASLATSAIYFLKKIPRKKEIEILIAWMICYLLFFSIGQFTARYLVILLPVLYLLTIYGLVESYPLLLRNFRHQIKKTK